MRSSTNQGNIGALQEKMEELGVQIGLSKAAQEASARRLRKLAIEYLRNGKGIVAEAFRCEYLNIGAALSESREEFLRSQSQEKVWAHSILLEALGELFGVTVLVTSYFARREEKTFVLHSEGPDAPVVHVDNHDDVHWSCDTFDSTIPGSTPTLSDGNCGLAAFGKALSLAVQGADQTQDNQERNDLYDQIELQQRAWKAITNSLPTREEARANFERQKERIAALPEEERKQIARDDAFALKLALLSNEEADALEKDGLDDDSIPFSAPKP